MKSTFVNCFLLLAVFCSATLFLSGPMAAGAIETKCRADVRAEMKGPNCRTSDVFAGSVGTFHPCVVRNSELTACQDKVAQCVARGGPGRVAR
jgi:hypothetical protein